MNFYHCKRRERKKPCAQLSHGLSIVKSFGRDRVVEVDSAECSNRDRITQKNQPQGTRIDFTMTLFLQTTPVLDKQDNLLSSHQVSGDDDGCLKNADHRRNRLFLVFNRIIITLFVTNIMRNWQK